MRAAHARRCKVRSDGAMSKYTGLHPETLSLAVRMLSEPKWPASVTQGIHAPLSRRSTVAWADDASSRCAEHEPSVATSRANAGPHKRHEARRDQRTDRSGSEAAGHRRRAELDMGAVNLRCLPWAAATPRRTCRRFIRRLSADWLGVRAADDDAREQSLRRKGLVTVRIA